MRLTYRSQQFYYFNKGANNTSLQVLRQDALSFASPSWNVEFYDSISQHVPNYVPSSGRTSWTGQISLPDGAGNAIAVLAQNFVDFQDNVLDTGAYQYWANIDSSGHVAIDRIKLGTYRLTVYADGIFGEYTEDDIDLTNTEPVTTTVSWTGESAGTEIWRIGTPDKSSGEYLHGYEPDPSHPLHPEQYRIYWAVYDYPTDFPEGVTFEIGKGDVGKDLNYVQWSVFGGYANSIRPTPYYGNGDVNNWTVAFDYDSGEFTGSVATFTVQLAGAKTAAGNRDVYNASEPYANLAYTVVVNGHALDPWIIP